MSQKLTLKQEAFAQAYLQTGNASEAYRSAYDFSPDCKPNTVEKRACELLKNGKVAGRLDSLQKELAERNGVTVDAIVEELRRIAFSNAGDFFKWGKDGVEIKDSDDLTPEQRAVIAEVSHTRTPGGGTIRVKMSDKQAALEKLGRYLGMFKDVKEHTGKGGKPLFPPAITKDMTPQEAAEAYAQILREDD